MHPPAPICSPLATARSAPPSTPATAPFSEWGNILYNTTIATAIADRLVENSEIFLLGGDSLRKAKVDRKHRVAPRHP
jgi:DNA replication protein DnaC